MKAIHFIPALFILLLFSCGEEDQGADAYGNFEAEEVIVSPESQGRILYFAQEEGDRLTRGEVVVVIDTTRLYLQKLQLESGKASLQARIATLDAQVKASMVQKQNLVREKARIDKMAEGGAATAKQQDDIRGQLDLIEAQIEATETQKASVNAERRTLGIQIDQLDDQIDRCVIRSPLSGTLLAKYKRTGEMAAPGQALYKMADMDELLLRVYLSGDQLSSVELGTPVKVSYDVAGGLKEVEGRVNWISSRAEFTPKIIQTREERVNLVYAVKIRVPNQGELKIGMPGEISF